MSLLSIFAKPISLSESIKKISSEIDQYEFLQKKLADLELQQDYPVVFQEKLFVHYVRFYFFRESYFEEVKLQKTIEHHFHSKQESDGMVSDFNDIEKYQKTLKALQEKFSYKNLHHLFNEPVCKTYYVKSLHQLLHHLFAQDWVFAKLKEANLVLQALLQVEKDKVLDFTNLLRIHDHGDGTQVVVQFLIDYSHFTWQLQQESLKQNLHEEFFYKQLEQYHLNSLIKTNS